MLKTIPVNVIRLLLENFDKDTVLSMLENGNSTTKNVKSEQSDTIKENKPTYLVKLDDGQVFFKSQEEARRAMSALIGLNRTLYSLVPLERK